MNLGRVRAVIGDVGRTSRMPATHAAIRNASRRYDARAVAYDASRLTG
jgi:hypothetical protein